MAGCHGSRTCNNGQVQGLDCHRPTGIARKPGMRTIGGKWVYARKIDGKTGLPSTYKARWVAKGYSQIQGIDLQEVFASVAHKDSNRMFLATVNYLDMECDQVDMLLLS